MTTFKCLLCFKVAGDKNKVFKFVSISGDLNHMLPICKRCSLLMKKRELYDLQAAKAFRERNSNVF